MKITPKITTASKMKMNPKKADDLKTKDNRKNKGNLNPTSYWPKFLDPKIILDQIGSTKPNIMLFRIV